MGLGGQLEERDEFLGAGGGFTQLEWTRVLRAVLQVLLDYPPGDADKSLRCRGQPGVGGWRTS